MIRSSGFSLADRDNTMPRRIPNLWQKVLLVIDPHFRRLELSGNPFCWSATRSDFSMGAFDPSVTRWQTYCLTAHSRTEQRKAFSVINHIVPLKKLATYTPQSILNVPRCDSLRNQIRKCCSSISLCPSFNPSSCSVASVPDVPLSAHKSREADNREKT